MEFRLDFFFRIFMDLAFYIVNISLFKLIYLHTDLLGGWTEPQVMIFVAGFLVLDAVKMTVFSNNLWWFPIYINRGDFDYYLVRPVSTLFFISLREFAANSFVNLLMTFGLLFWVLSQYSQPLTVFGVLLFLFLIFNGAFLIYMLHLILLIPVFWTHSGRGLGEIYYSMKQLIERPDRIYTGWFRKIVLTVLPFGLMASLPARLLIEGFEWSSFMNIILVTGAFFLFLQCIWRVALRSYSSASS